jgi:aminoglycoside 2'-N-acetyltransferase I
VRIRRLSTPDLQRLEIVAIRELLDDAFAGAEGYRDEDWGNALGGVHFVLDENGRIVAHVSVVERELQAGDLPLRTGYVEAVATLPSRQGLGYASRLMGEAERLIDGGFELGALATAGTTLYARRGWTPWRGPTYVRTHAGPVRTPEDDDAVLVRSTPTSPELDVTEPISCEWRPGDPW